MKSMNKYLLLTSSAMIVARVASAALETDAKENKAVVNKLEFNRKYSELTPPTLVIPPFSSAKDYKRLAGICFLGVGDCGSGITFGKGDDYTKPCETINPCTGFNLTNTASCTDGYTTCNTGCEDKFKCNPPQYTQTCEFPYQGVGTPKDGKYKSCECQAAFKYGTGDCPSPKVPDTSGTSCDGKYSSCICPSTYTEYCSSPYVGVGDSCDGKYQSCQCPATYTRDCESEGLSGVGDAADRQRLRQEARKGQWDGQYWNEDGKRYTSGQYRDHLLGNTKPQTRRPPQAPARRDYSQLYRPGTPAPRPGMVPNPPGAPVRYNPNKAFPPQPVGPGRGAGGIGRGGGMRR